MSDWKFLEQHRVTKPTPGVMPQYVTDSSWGFCGMFRFVVNNQFVRCVVSDGMGWKHVSVSIEGDKRTPKWETMCAVKDLFFEPEDWVVQFHPAHSEYVNYHPGCLHLWKSDQPFPVPSSIMVGPKQVAKNI